MAADYNTGDSLTKAVTACQTALATLQRLGQSDQADGPLTDAESSTNYAALDSDVDHSDAWKLQRYAQTYSNVVSTLARRLTSVANTAGKQDASDAANVLGIGGLKGDVASLSISRRDAGDRVADENDTASLQRLLATATRIGDEPLARAIAEKALALGDADTLNQFTAGRPSLADAVERLWTAQNRKSTTTDLTVGFRLTALKPAALASRMDYEIAALAAGQTTAGR